MTHKKPKVAIFFNVREASGAPKLGGAERRLARIFDLLSHEDKVETQLILKVVHRSDVIEQTYQQVLRHKSLKIVQFEKFGEIASYMRRERFDWICYTSSYRLMVPFMLFGVIFGAKRMMLIVTSFLAELKFDNSNQKRLFNLVAWFSNHLDVLYPNGLKCLKEKYPNKPVTLTPGGFTDLELFKPSDKQRKIVHIGTLQDKKNPDLFVKAIALIKSFLIEHNYSVYLCGIGPMQEELRNLVAESGCGSLIQMPGHVKPEEYLPTTELFVTVMSFNNYPSQSMLEATACGCYIVASDEGDTRLIVKEEFGVLCELSAEVIAKNILNYIEKSESEKAKIVDAARAFAIDNFSIDKSVQHYEQLFKKGA